MPARYDSRMDTKPVTTRAILVGAMLGTALAAGCAAPDNDRLSLGTSADPVVVLPAIEQGPALTDATGPSITSLDRSAWAQADFVVPNDATEHYPHFTRLQPRYDKGTARARGAYPTAQTALEQEGSFGSIFAESIAWPGYVAGDTVMIIPRAVDPDQNSPMTHYERAPGWTEDASASGAVPTDVTRTAPATATPRATKAKAQPTRSKKPRSIGPARW
jgi:hypothetical protein